LAQPDGRFSRRYHARANVSANASANASADNHDESDSNASANHLFSSIYCSKHDAVAELRPLARGLSFVGRNEWRQCNYGPRPSHCINRIIGQFDCFLLRVLSPSPQTSNLPEFFYVLLVLFCRLARALAWATAAISMTKRALRRKNKKCVYHPFNPLSSFPDTITLSKCILIRYRRWSRLFSYTHHSTAVGTN
jgi:hypothetical protein